MFSKKLQQAIGHVSGDCAGELHLEDDEDCSFESILAETELDAGRLVIWGYPEEHAEAVALIAQHGWDAVVREAEKFVCS